LVKICVSNKTANLKSIITYSPRYQVQPRLKVTMVMYSCEMLMAQIEWEKEGMRTRTGDRQGRITRGLIC